MGLEAQEAEAQENSALEREMESLVNKHIVPHVNSVREAEQAIQELHRELMSKMERDSKPDDQSVKDLEAKKIEQEHELETLQARVRELELEVRQDLAQPERAGNGKAADFRGAVVRNIEEFMQAIDQYGSLDNAMQKRAIDTSAISSAGALNTEQEARFLDWLIEKQMTLNRVRLRRMRAPNADLDELITAEEQLRAGSEGVAPSVSDAITFAKRSLSTKETIWAEDLTLSFLEDNLERAGAEDHIMMNLARAFGNDHNNLFWRGNEADSGAFLQINDGIIALAKADGDVTDADATGDSTAEAVLQKMLRAMEFDFAIRPDLTFFMPYRFVLSYADELTNRETAIGDQVLVNGLPAARYFGLPVLGEPHLNKTGMDEGVLTFAQNLVWGVQRGVTVESEWRPRKRAVEITISARTDQNYVKSQALVLADNIDSALIS